MPRFLLRPHRRANSSQPPPAPASAAATTAPSPLARDRSATLSSTPAPLDVLPTVQVGPALGSPTSWLDPKTMASVEETVAAGAGGSSTTLATTAAGGAASSLAFSRTSTPHTALTSELSPTPVPSVPRPANHRQTASSPSLPFAASPASDHATPPPPKQKTGKRKSLNPMSLLRRRSSGVALLGGRKDDLPEDFDPGIIYGTRHPDWSTPRNARPNNVPVISPMAGADGKMVKMEVVDKGGQPTMERKSGFVERFDDEEPPKVPQVGPEVGRAASQKGSTSPPVGLSTIDSIKPTEEAQAKTVVPQTDAAFSDNEGELHAIEEEEPKGRRKGVTLVDHPLALPHHNLINTSRFSFEGSASTPGSPLAETSRPPSRHDGSRDDIEADVDDEDDEGAFDFDLEDMDDGDDEGFAAANEGIYELQQAVRAMDLSAASEKTEPNYNMGMSLGNIGLAVSGTPGRRESAQEAETRPQGLGLFGVSDQPQDVPADDSTMNVRRALANPRGLDLDDDSDLEALEEEAAMGHYEDDDLYFDDGIITGENPEHEAPSDDLPDDSMPQLSSDPPNPETPPNLNIDTSGVRASMLPQDGSAISTPGTPQTFPPFLNPVGPGPSGFTPQQSAFYAPADPLNPLALSNLNYTLQQYQQQQQAAGEGSSGYDSDAADFPGGGYFSEDETFGGYDDDGFGDDDLIAAANGEVLASDEGGWYGSEFGMFQNGQWVGRSDLSRNDTLRPPMRRPSLTPISERSESSYRNSLVFPQGQWQPRTGSVIVDTDDMTLSQLLALRKQQWGGGSRPPSVSSNGSSPAVTTSALDNWRPPSRPVSLPPSMVATSPDGRESGIPLSPPPPQDYIIGPWIDMRRTVPPSPPVETPPPLPEGFGAGFGMGTSETQTRSPLQFPPGLSPPPGLGLGMGSGMGMGSPTPLPPRDPPGLSKTPPGLSKTPPGLAHAGANAMLPTKGSFEDVGV